MFLYFTPWSPMHCAKPVKSGLNQAQGNRHRNREAQALTTELPAGLRVMNLESRDRSFLATLTSCPNLLDTIGAVPATPSA